MNANLLIWFLVDLAYLRCVYKLEIPELKCDHNIIFIFMIHAIETVMFVLWLKR